MKTIKNQINLQDYKDHSTSRTVSSITNKCSRRYRNVTLFIFVVTIVSILFFLLFRGNRENLENYTNMVKNYTSKAMNLEAQTLAVAKSEVKMALEKYLNSIDPHEIYPDDVNMIKPHHIRVIGAMGDSLTIGSRAENIVGQRQRYPGNAFFTGMDFEVDRHLTVYNIFRIIAEKTGNKLFGGSTGIDYGENTGLNVAIGGMKSDDILRQAKELVSRIKANKEINIENDWKLVSLWIGTNDVGTLGYRLEDPIPVDEYKSHIEKGLLYLKENLPRTIVSIVGMFPAQLLQEAQSILKNGKRARTVENQKKLDDLSDGYRNVSYDFQNNEHFNSNDFTVVVQPFATEYTDSYRDEHGKYNPTFYASDLFHLSKFGHAVLAKHYWLNLFEPVGEKTKRADLGDTKPKIYELNEKNCLIKTVGNSKM